MDKDTMIRAEGVGKKYVLGTAQEPAQFAALRNVITAKVKAPFERLRRRWRGDAEVEATGGEFWALRDVNFEVRRGEVVGIIGRNGAGKSTLLKVLSRITEPTTGRIALRGRVASLLEVGTGFHPELTGRENIFLNGAILGMHRREIKAKFDEIVAFAEVERFLDTPVKRYSSGMYVRLAFAVAAHLEPEILIVDEVLAVGDAEFQKKCLGKMKDVAADGGRTVLFVSHQINAVQSLCSQCLLLKGGQLAAIGPTAAVISAYLQAGSTDTSWAEIAGESSPYENPYFRPTRLALVDAEGAPIQRDIRADEKVGVLIEGWTERSDEALTVGFAVSAASGELLYWALHTDSAVEQWPKVQPGHNRLVAWLPGHLLNEGDYRVEMMVSLHWRDWLCKPGVKTPMISFRLRGGLSKSPLWMMARPGLVAPIITFENFP